jgi:hypothetical protein
VKTGGTVPKLFDNQVGDRLYAALEAIGTDEGETIRGNTALVAARQTLSLLAAGKARPSVTMIWIGNQTV